MNIFTKIHMVFTQKEGYLMTKPSKRTLIIALVLLLLIGILFALIFLFKGDADADQYVDTNVQCTDGTVPLS